MTTPSWSAGTLYNPGAVVQRNSASAVVASPPDNPGFESGDVSWTKGTGWLIGNFSADFDGVNTAKNRGTIGTFRIYQTTPRAAVPGLTITASCQCRRGQSGMTGRVQLEWLDSGMTSLRIDDGTLIDSGEDKWKQSSVTATAPANTAYVRLGATVTQNHTDRNFYVDAFQWNYAYSPPIDALIFQAVQAAAGYSGGVEPIWPTTVGGTVVDNEVTWQAIDSSTVTWEASPILVSGPNEPSFPLEVGATVADNTIVWTAVARRVEDEKCPNTAVVAIAASKIFAADDDIIAYSATVNPLDWSTTDDAGYLPFGLQTYGANPVKALGLYRSNLVAFNVNGFQMWQVDPDPQQMALLDAVPIGCKYHRTLQPFQNDLIFLSEVGVRNIGIAGASTNLQAGVFGKPIDPLIKTWIKDGTYDPRSAFIPAYGQYWITFGYEADVLTTTGLKEMSWSRYVFPRTIDTITQGGGSTYIRTGDDVVWILDDDETADDVYCQPTPPVLFCDCDGTGLTSVLSWYEAVYDTQISQYLILRSKDSSLFIQIDAVDGDVLTYTDVTVEAGHTYQYMIVAHPDETGINSEPSNTVVCDFPAAVTPAGSSAPASVPPADVEAQCFNDYTKLVDTERQSSDGVSIDPELQFTTEANKGYWLYGHLYIMQSNAAGTPGFQGCISHAGDTDAFQFMGSHASGFDSTADKVGGIYWQPIDASRMTASGNLASSSVSDTAVYHVIIDATLLTGASGGLCGLSWGILNSIASGKTKLLAGSYFSVLELLR